jgi:predicted peptidase
VGGFVNYYNWFYSSVLERRMIMKHCRNLCLLLLTVIFFSCSEDEEILPQQPVAVADTVIVVNDEETTVTNTKEPDLGSLLFLDSAFYQAATFNELPYRILVPRDFDAAKTYPLLIFLHGIDERGTDNEKQLKWGSSLFVSDSISNNYPAFVVFPQCPKSNYWFDTSALGMLKALIDNLVTTLNVDPEKVYIGGLSMGAYGTYAMVAKHPELFAAAVAISGDGDVNKAQAMSKVKWRIFGGGKDDIVPGERSSKMAKALERSGASVSLTIYPEANHVGSWVKAFKEPDFCSWLFSKSKDHS